jgi:exodeoxyribonuclease V beta subunit
MTAPDAAQPLDVAGVELDGLQVIEASAGTGKTWTITQLYLRLVVERDLPVEQILVVTYTVAATEELRRRIRQLLDETLAALRGTQPLDEALAPLAERAGGRDAAAERVQRALWSLDQAAIHTIHGFCQRVLTESAFESGAPFTTDVVADQTELLQEVVDDYWRRHVADASPLFVQHLVDAGVSPETLARDVAPYLGRPDLAVITPARLPDEAERERACLDAWERLRAMWPAAREPLEALLTCEGLNKKFYRVESVLVWLARMDDYVRTTLPRKAFPRLEKLTASSVEGAWKKNTVHRTHDALAACEAFVTALAAATEACEARHRRLVGDLLAHAREELGRRKRRRRVVSYDDLLLLVRAALGGRGGDALAAWVRRRWPAALVDEFQDTDPVQFEIVERVWGGAPGPVFLVGDPKQAIYAFRGADIYAYLRARRRAAARHTLDVNWRSDPALITAVNAVLGGSARPFVLAEVPFVEARPAVRRDRRVLTIDGEPAEPLHVWFLARDDEEKLYPKTKAVRRIAQATATEIARLLRLGERGAARLDDRALSGGDIVVLVRTNQQGRLVRAALAERGVASVQQSEDSVFDTREARDLERILLAVADPGRDELVRAALATEILGWSGERIHQLLDDEQTWTAEVEAFHELGQRWRERGVARMFRELLRKRGVAERLLGFADGERRLTNLLHLGELLQDEAGRGRHGPEALVQWMAERRASPRAASEEHQLRLESDEHLVRIVTVHKAKGLQYPIVFCPFLWDGRIRSSESKIRNVFFHDPAADDRPTLMLGIDPSPNDPRRAQPSAEELAESLRLLYVALTRAEHRCVLVWGAINDAASSPLAWLLHHPGGADGVQAMRDAWRDITDASLDARLDDLVRRSAGTIRRLPLPSPDRTPYRPPAADPEVLRPETFAATIPDPWRIASFTGLVAGRHREGPDHDAVRIAPAEDAVFAAGADAFGFPAGARAGLCLHAILERLDFCAVEPGPLVTDTLERFGFDAGWAPAIGALLARVVDTALHPCGIRLAAVPRHARLDELEFHYPLARFDAEGLRAILHAHDFAGGIFAGAVNALDFRTTHGFMRGFIDVVFEADGRWWLADYKSNWLGATLEDYAAEGLPAVMARESYFLQYLVYTVVLHRLLALRLPDYDYDRHVGGVLYLFLRGMDPERGHACGVFHDRPSRALIEALDAWIGEGA